MTYFVVVSFKHPQNDAYLSSVLTVHQPHLGKSKVCQLDVTHGRYQQTEIDSTISTSP